MKMFIIKPIEKEEAVGELKLIYRMIEKKLGFIPPHFKLFATIDLEGMKDFLEYNELMLSHNKIDNKIYPYLRLYVANKECRSYCINFNTHILENMNVDKKFLNDSENNIQNIPFSNEQKTLLQKVIKAIYASNQFSENDLNELLQLGFSNKDFFDLLSYTTNFISKSKLIEIYLS